MKKYFFAFSLFGLMACGEGTSGGGAASTKKGPSRGLEANVLKVSGQSLIESIQTTGTVMANEQVELKAEESGRLIKISFKEGSEVSKGSPLFQIDDRDFQAQAKNVQVNLNLAKKEFERNSSLLKADAISQEAYDASANKVASLQAELDILLVRIERCLTRAPFSGRIGLRQVSEGAYISVGQSLVSLVQERPIKIEFEVPEIYASRIIKGMPLNAFASSGSDTLDATIYAFESSINAGSRNLKVRAICDGDASRIVPGSYLSISLELEETDDAIMIPSEAVVPELNGQMVFLVKNGVVKSQKVSTGLRRANDIQILSGLDAGDSILLTGILQARDGMPVQAIESVR